MGGGGQLEKLNPRCMEENPFWIGHNYGFGGKKNFFKGQTKKTQC